jgi:glycine/D-amino acid oxidase-like deaminating enzyme
LHWFRTEQDSYRVERGGPCFFFEVPEGYFYGFPQIDERGVKLAEHSGGAVVEDPLHDDRSVEPRDLERVRQFLRQAMPGVTREQTQHAVCYYTMSPDEHFVVDRHPQWPSVVYAAGLSGHGFKFTSVLGEVLADLAMRGETDQPIRFLSAARFGRP